MPPSVDDAGSAPAGVRAPLGLVCALEEELGSLRERVRATRRVIGLEVHEVELPGASLLACVGGVGKVAAARATSVLLREGALGGLLVVGVCGGLRRALGPGTLVHCTRAAQVDLAVRRGREVTADEGLRGLWRAVAPGPEGWFLTADRPVLNPWRRARLARAFAGPCVADMETAAAAAVARAGGVPWAALRAVTDRAGPFALASCLRNLPTQAGRAADTVVELVAALGRDPERPRASSATPRNG